MGQIIIFSDVLEKALITYFQYEEALPIVGAIERYIVQHVIKECYRGPHCYEVTSCQEQILH